MVLINGRKFACEACIRGHRASSCSHTGRQLQQVRPKGRPSSQCDTCKSKRINGSFHGKCQCNAVGTNGTSSPEEDRLLKPGYLDRGDDPSSMMGETSKGRLSLESLMNPCRCKTTGICTCCKSETIKENGDMLPQITKGDSCCDGGACCVGGACCTEPSVPSSSSHEKVASSSCCSGQVSNRTSNLNSHQTMEKQFLGSVTQPPCQCGPNCSCPNCLDESESTRQVRAKAGINEECPEKCLTCSACAFGLTRPSGIEAVDEWMEREKQGSKRVSETEEKYGNDASKKRNGKTFSPQDSTFAFKKQANPILPPIPGASDFYSSHFANPERRRYFADQLRAVQNGSLNTPTLPSHEQLPEHKEYGKRLLGESDEDWQVRHGFYYLTPEAIRIFDSAREFRERRQQEEEDEEEERLEVERRAISIEAKASQSSSLSPSLPVMPQELDDLRRKALLARKKNPNTTFSTPTSVK